jgi:transposase
MRKFIDWPAIRTAYIAASGTGISYRELARRFDVSRSTVARRASAEGWVEDRERFREDAAARALDRVMRDEVSARVRHASGARKLFEKTVEALKDLDPSKMTPTDIRNCLVASIEMERAALGLAAEVRVEVVRELDSFLNRLEANLPQDTFRRILELTAGVAPVDVVGEAAEETAALP